ncbi:MAG: MmgE/PrpD family protein, partial [Chloroflexota bacterium]
TVAVAIAGYDSEPARIAADFASLVHSDRGATVFGHGISTSPELAAFANAIMVRTYDWNDGMLARGGGHPSDMTSGILAVAEVCHSSGLDTLVAMTLAYELLGGLGSEITILEHALGPGTGMGAATALAAGKLLGLDREQLANAASLALVPNLPLAVSRWGELSMMKGATTAFAVRAGVFAAMLAGKGFTSAGEPFEGIYGLHKMLGPFEVKLPALPDGPRVVQMSHQKPIPADTQGLALLDLVPKIRAWAKAEDIESIDIDAPEHAARHVGDEAKYDPRTRETADHSLPYMLAVALVDGEITLASYKPERFLDPALRPLMRKIAMHPDEAMTKLNKTAIVGATRPTPRRITVRTKDGRELVEEVMWHKGTMHNPMTRDDINAKLDTICRNVVDHAKRERIRSAWWNITEAPDVAEPIKTLASF